MRGCAGCHPYPDGICREPLAHRLGKCWCHCDSCGHPIADCDCQPVAHDNCHADATGSHCDCHATTDYHTDLATLSQPNPTA